MTARFFVDANVLIYAYDAAEPLKQGTATAVLETLTARGAGLLSTQVLGEFFSIVTRRIPQPLTLQAAADEVRLLAELWPVAEVTRLVVLEAIRGAQTYPFSYWDAQIWAAARLNQATVVLSEDFQDGRVIEAVEFRNPFAPTFDPAILAPSL